jgi:hypothetical protein
MNAILVKHGGKILFGVTFLICAGIIAYISSDTDPASFDQLASDQEKLQNTIAGKRVSKDYRYSAENVKLEQAFQANAKRGQGELEEAPKYIVYERPSKPTIDPDSLPKSDVERTSTVEVATGNLSELSAKADHGVVYLTYKLPNLTQMAGDKKVMDVVRVEIFRGLTAEKIDTKAPYTVVDFAQEEPLNLDLAADDTAAAPKENEDNESIGEKRRKHRSEEAAPAPAPAAHATDKKPDEVPSEFAGVRAYGDTNVQPKNTYYYKARLITRLNIEPEKPIVDRLDKDNKPEHFTVYKAPKGVEPVAPAKAGSKTLLYASPMSEVVSATAPVEYEIRLAGSDGDISEPGTRATLINENYKGIFVVRVWVMEAKEWREANVTIPKGDVLKGEARSPSGKKPITYEFNTNYELEEIKWKQGTREVVEKVMQMQDGVPVKDKDTGKPVYHEEKKIVDSIPVKVAVLKDLKTGTAEEYSQSNDFKRRDQGIEIIKKLAEAEEKAREEQKKQWEVVKRRIAQEENKIKQKAAAAEAEASRLNGPTGVPRGGGPPAPNGMGGPGGAGGPGGPGGMNGGGAGNGPMGGGGGGGGPMGGGGGGGGGRGKY